MRKLLIFMLVFTLICSAVPVWAQGNIDESADFEENLSVLSVYGISITANEKGFVTNKDLAFTLLSMLNIDTANDFDSAAETLRAAGVIPGNMRFLSQTEAAADEAYTYCVNALGYGARTQYGANTDILRKLKSGVADNTKLTEQAWARIVRNALTIPCSELAGIKRGGADYKEGRNIIEKYHGGLYVRDIIYATDNAAVSGYEAFIKKDCVYAGDTYIYAYENDIDKYLGYKAELFCVGDGDDYAVKAYVIAGSNVTETIKCRDIDYALGFDASDATEYKTSPVIYYYNENGKRVSERLSNSVTVLYNANPSPDVGNDDFKGENGTVRLIDYNKDGVYDVVYIRKYFCGVVAAADNNSKILTMEGGASYDFGGLKRLTVTEGGRTAEFSAIGTGSVVGIYACGDMTGKAEIEIFTNLITGKAASVDTENLKVTVDDTEYEYISDIGSLKPGLSYSFITDNDGILVYRATAGSDMSYAYFTEFSIEGSIDTPVRIKVLDLNNTYHSYVAADKIRYTGFDEHGVWLEDKAITKSRFGDILNTVFTGHTLVKIAWDGDVLKKLAFAKDTTGNSDYKGYDEDNFTMECEIDGRNSGLVRTGRSLSPNCRAMPNVTVCILDNLNDKEDIEVCAYSLGNANVLVESSYCMEKGYAYDTNKKLIASVFVLQYDPVANNNMVQNCNTLTGASRMLVDRVINAVNSEGEETYIVSGYMMDGRLVKYTAKNEDVTQKFNSAWCDKNPCTVGQLKRGDIIIPVVGRSGDMVNFYLLLGLDDSNKAPEHYKAYNGATENQHDNGINTVYGKIQKNFDNNTVMFENVPNTHFLINGTIYVCDFAKGKIFLTDAGEYIRDASTGNADTVMMIRNHHLAELTVIYRY